MAATSIEWTEHSVNPIRARSPREGKSGHYCEKVSAGCKNCYSSRFQPRVGLPQFQEQRRDPPPMFLDASKLEEVLRRRKPTKWFWCDMTDMFGHWVPFEWIAACFGVMAATPHHTHQILTKRPERAVEWFSDIETTVATIQEKLPLPPLRPRSHWFLSQTVGFAEEMLGRKIVPGQDGDTLVGTWPLPNVHLGVSVEDQQRADERIPLLLKCPAAVRWISAEPLLGPIDIAGYFSKGSTIHLCVDVAGALRNRSFDGLMGNDGRSLTRSETKRALEQLLRDGVRVVPTAECDGFSDQTGCPGHRKPGLDWVVVGGESGPGARAYDLAWTRSIIAQCRAAGVQVFHKQVGKAHVSHCGQCGRTIGMTRGGLVDECGPTHAAVRAQHVQIRDRKGGDMSEWPADLRVREFPEARHA